MSALGDSTFELFKKSVLEDDDNSYPDHVDFVREDLPNADAVVWRNLHHEGRATVVVMANETEMLLLPAPRTGLGGMLDRLRGRERVLVTWRHHEFASPYPVRTRVGRAPLTDLRRAAAIA